jgi:hypothetical protein
MHKRVDPGNKLDAMWGYTDKRGRGSGSGRPSHAYVIKINKAEVDYCDDLTGGCSIDKFGVVSASY